MAFTKYAYDYVSDEAHAKASRSGVWEGSFETPWDYRQTYGAGGSRSATPERRTIGELHD